jgi:hypothetical protein
MEHTDGCERRGDKVSEGTLGEGSLDAAGVFDEHRGLLVSVAYRVLGSVTDAEDAVQETWLRWSGVDHSEVGDPRAYLVRVTTRLAGAPAARPAHPYPYDAALPGREVHRCC